MSIRVRQVDGATVALCAAETEPEPGDFYLDDNVHQALADKFLADWTGNGLIPSPAEEVPPMISELGRGMFCKTHHQHVGWTDTECDMWRHGNCKIIEVALIPVVPSVRVSRGP